MDLLDITAIGVDLWRGPDYSPVMAKKSKWTLVAKPKSNVVRIDSGKAAVMSLKTQAKLNGLLTKALNGDDDDSPKGKTAKKRRP